MNDTIKLKDGTTPPNTLTPGELAIDEAGRLLYLKTHRGAVAIPLDRMALEPADENASSEVYVWRSTLIGERVVLGGGGGANYRDDRHWRVFGLAPRTIGSSNVGVTALFDITYPTVIRTLRSRVLSGSGSLTWTINAWTDGALGAQLDTHTVTVSSTGAQKVNTSLSLDPGHYALTVTGDASLSLETVEGLLPWIGTTQVHLASMSEETL